MGSTTTIFIVIPPLYELCNNAKFANIIFQFLEIILHSRQLSTDFLPQFV